MKEQKHLPMYGVGPMYVIVCVLVTVTGILLTKAGLLNTGNIVEWKILCIIAGMLLIIAGAYLWIVSVLIQKVQKNIEENRLATTGVYAWVRNPIYCGIVAVIISGVFFGIAHSILHGILQNYTMTELLGAYTDTCACGLFLWYAGNGGDGCCGDIIVRQINPKLSDRTFFDNLQNCRIWAFCRK